MIYWNIFGSHHMFGPHGSAEKVAFDLWKKSLWILCMDVGGHHLYKETDIWWTLPLRVCSGAGFAYPVSLKPDTIKTLDYHQVGDLHPNLQIIFFRLFSGIIFLNQKKLRGEVIFFLETKTCFPPTCVFFISFYYLCVGLSSSVSTVSGMCICNLLRIFRAGNIYYISL